MYGNPNNSIDIDVDNIIEKLLEMKDKKTLKQVNLSENEVRGLCIKSREVFLSQPILVELEAPLKVCGDIHGQYHDLLRLFEYGGFPPESNYLFLGDYVDRGQNSLETICLLLAFKIKFPENFFLLRGNHECASINRIYGFYDECKRRYNIKLWKTFTDCFNCLPVAALIDGKIFCMHGGLSPELSSLEQIQRIIRPTDIPDTGLLCDLLWSDPEKDVQGWGENERGVSYVFGPEIVSVFLKKHDLDLICRAHQVVEDGYEFFAKRQLVTLFSAPNYCGEYDNSGAMMSVDDTLMCSFQILRPSDSKTTVEPGQGRPNTPPRGGKTQSPTNCPPPKTLSGMANITHSPEWMAAKANLSSMVHCPTPIRRFAPTCRLALLKSISVPDLPSQDTILRRQRPTKSFNERQSYPTFNSVHNQNFNSPAEQMLNAERAASLDVIEDIECFEEVVPPARAGNPVIYDEEFLKIDDNRSKRTILSIGRRSQIQSAFGIQEP